MDDKTNQGKKEQAMATLLQLAETRAANHLCPARPTALVRIKNIAQVLAHIGLTAPLDLNGRAARAISRTTCNSECGEHIKPTEAGDMTELDACECLSSDCRNHPGEGNN